MTVRTRIAPSPTGDPHVGTAYVALFNYALARQQGGQFVLRIEDTDEARNQPEWTQGIIDALAWIGISADDPHFEGPLYQSEYADAHVAAAQRLYEEGAAYYCDLTGEQVHERAKDLGIQVPIQTPVSPDEKWAATAVLASVNGVPASLTTIRVSPFSSEPTMLPPSP